MDKSKGKSMNPFNRRGFLTGAATGVAGLATKPPVAMAQQAALKPEAHAAAEVTSNQRSGFDFMVDVFKSLGIEYIAAKAMPNEFTASRTQPPWSASIPSGMTRRFPFATSPSRRSAPTELR
jgi:hypothetical protein